MCSNIPFEGPIAEVRVGRINGEYIVNPTHTQLKESDMDMIVGGTEDSIVMVEGDSKEASETDILAAIKFAHDNIKLICALQKELAAERNVVKKEFVPAEKNTALIDEVKALASKVMSEIHRSDVTKDERSQKYKELYESITLALAEKYPEQDKAIAKIFDDIQYYDMREMILTEGRRLDGRKTTDIRPITCEVGYLPRNHGSALFTRDETQSLTSMTLGTKSDKQIIDGWLPYDKNRNMLHDNFPPISTSETR